MAEQLTAGDFRFVTDFVRQRSAIDLQPGKEYLVESRLAPVARKVGADGIQSLVSRLRSGEGAVETAVVDALTTNETSWFRDNAPFDAFTSHILPEAAAASTTKQLNIWSAACSSGQEAYSLAMLLLDWLPANPAFTAQIIGTDISRTMVERARTGRFTQLEVNRGMRASYLVRYFTQVGREWQLKPEVQNLCRFAESNLALPPIGIPMCDVVFLRNVLIYFDVPTKRKVLTHVRQVLKPGGYLMLGGAESTLTLDEAFTRVEVGRTSVYRLTGGTA